MPIILGFDFSGGWATLIYVLGGVLVIVAALQTAFGWFGRLWRWLRPEPPIPPVILCSDPDYSYSTFTDPSERNLQKTQYLSRLRIGYVIENKEPAITVTNVETGVRRKNTDLDQPLHGFKAPALAPLEKTPPQGFDLPQEFIEGLADGDFQQQLLLWVRFTTPDRRRWEVVCDPVTRELSAVVLKGD